MIKLKNKILNMYTINFKKQTTMQMNIKYGQGNLFINKKTLNTFFNRNILLLQKLKILKDYKKKFIKYNIYITVTGGGLENQFQLILISIFKLLLK
jgi:ribosomal protein S9